jgi:hypothetical protein
MYLIRKNWFSARVAKAFSSSELKSILIFFVTHHHTNRVGTRAASQASAARMTNQSATLARVKTARITKIAGLSFAGFVIASIVADKGNLNPLASQIAGFAGAFVGSLVGRRRAIRRIAAQPLQRDEASVRPHMIATLRSKPNNFRYHEITPSWKTIANGHSGAPGCVSTALCSC